MDLCGKNSCANFSGVSIDTRTIKPGNLFVALVGANSNGHKFIDTAIAKGAAAVLSNKNESQQAHAKCPLFYVSDTTKALGQLAGYWRNQFHLPIIAVTGSNGKTTVKNMIGSILQKECGDAESVLVSHGNFNNHIGVPLNLFQLNSKHRYAVIEMGMNHLGEIAYLTQMAKPSVAVITNASAAHLEGLGSLDNVAKAKGEILSQFVESGANCCHSAILNADDSYYDYWRNLAKNQDVMSISLESGSDVFATELQLAQDNSQFVLHTPIGETKVTLPLSGKHNVMNALAATAACLPLNISLSSIKAGLESIQATDKRLEIKKIRSGIYLLNDCYNANPASLYAAIDVLMTYPGKKVLILGDMKELGEQEAQLHFEAGEYAKKARVDCLLAMGDLTKETVKAFGGGAQHFDIKEDLLDFLQTLLAKDVSILVKGSRSMKMEEVVEGITHQLPNLG